MKGDLDARLSSPRIWKTGMMFTSVKTDNSLSISFKKFSQMFYELSFKLRYRKICARWVPRMPTDEYKQKHMGGRFWNVTTARVMKSWTITLEEMRLGPHTMYQRVSGSLKEWHHTNSSGGGTTIKADTFNCKNHGQHFLGHERHSFDSFLALWRDHPCRHKLLNIEDGVCLLHCSAWPHTAEETIKLLQEYDWETLTITLQSTWHLHTCIFSPEWKSFWAANRWQLMKKWNKQLWIGYVGL
jgi:hypothetical protein